MLSILCVRLTIKVKVGIPESFKVGWYPPKKTGSSHLNRTIKCLKRLQKRSIDDNLRQMVLIRQDRVLIN